jgi:phospholipase C
LIGRNDVFSVDVEGAVASPASLLLENLTSAPQAIVMSDLAYGAPSDVITLRSEETRSIPLDLVGSHGWYDRQFVAGGQTLRIAGHVENGEASYSDPAAGGPGPLRLGTSA